METYRYKSTRKLDIGQESEFDAYEGRSSGNGEVGGLPATEVRSRNASRPAALKSHPMTMKIVVTASEALILFIDNLANIVHSSHEENGACPDLTKFEMCTITAQEIIPESDFRLLLKQYGWIGDKYKDEEWNRPSFREQFLKAAKNFYLKNYQDVNMFTPARKRANTAEAVTDYVVPFCPDILVEYLHSQSVLETHKHEEDATKQASHGVVATNRHLSVPPMHKVRSFSFRGACVLADISGFSKFSGRMCLQGVSGLDELREATNGFLGHFVKLVYEFGGDVIAFAGDALICVFKDTEFGTASKIQDCCFRAILCADLLRQHTLETHNLSAHIGITFGEMKVGLLGGHNNQWVFLLNGECVKNLNECIEDSDKQELVVSHKCYMHALKASQALKREGISKDAALTASTPTKNEGSKNWRIDSVSDHRNEKKRGSLLGTRAKIDSTRDAYGDNYNLELLGFVPRPVAKAINTHTVDHLSELREVTTMFCKLSSYDIALHEDPTSLQDFLFLAQQILAVSGGFLRQFLVDDKGCVFIAMWGTPGLTYTNNCTRAVYTAITLQSEALKLEFPHQLAIGVTTGNVYCGTIGSPLRQDYVGIGNEVNLSARLMSKAGKRIICDDATYRNLNAVSQKLFVAAEEMVLKGIAKPIRPWAYGGHGVPSLSGKDERASVHGAEFFTDIMSVHEQDQESFHEYVEFLTAPTVLEHTNKKHRYLEVTGMGSFKLEDDSESPIKAQNHSLNRNPVYPIRSHSSENGSDSAEVTDNARFIFLIGMPGTGKGVLTRYFKSVCLDSNVKYLAMRLDSADLSPYSGIKQMFLEIVGVSHFETTAHCSKNIWKWMCALLRYEQRNSRQSSPSELIDGMSMRNACECFASFMGVSFDFDPVEHTISNFMNDLSGLDTKEVQNMKTVGHTLNHTEDSILHSIHSTSNESTNHRPSLTSASKDSVVSASSQDNAIKKSVDTKRAQSPGLASGAGMSSSEHIDTAAAAATATAGATASTAKSSTKSSDPDCSDLGRKSRNSNPRLSLSLENISTQQSPISIISSTSPTQMSDYGDIIVRTGSPSSLDFGLQSMKSAMSGPNGLAHMRNCGEILFIKLLSVVLKFNPVAIVVEQGQYFDESSWNVLNRLQQYALSKMIILITMRPVLKEGGKDDGKKQLMRKSKFREERADSPKSQQNLHRASKVTKKMHVSHSHQHLPKNTHGIKFSLVNSGWAVLEHCTTKVIETHGMSKDDVRAFLIERLALSDPTVLSEDLVRIVFDLSSGSMQWCEEIISYIKQKGFSNLNIHELGESFGNPEMWIVQRMEKLASHAQVALKYAAIIGHDFHANLLAAIVPYVRQEKERWDAYIANILQLLVENGFLFLSQEYPFKLYEFKNQVTQDALYRGVPLHEAAHVHHRIAEFYEVQYEDRSLAPFYSRLAIHYLGAKSSYPEDRALGFKYMMKAADKAIAGGAINESLDILTEALEIADGQYELALLLRVVEIAQVDIDKLYMTTAQQTIREILGGESKNTEITAKTELDDKDIGAISPISMKESLSSSGWYDIGKDFRELELEVASTLKESIRREKAEKNEMPRPQLEYQLSYTARRQSEVQDQSKNRCCIVS